MLTLKYIRKVMRLREQIDTGHGIEPTVYSNIEIDNLKPKLRLEHETDSNTGDVRIVQKKY